MAEGETPKSVDMSRFPQRVDVDLSLAVDDDQFFQTLSKALNEQFGEDKKPWVVWVVNVRVAQVYTILAGSWLKTMRQFCKAYYERLQAYSTGFVVVLPGGIVRTVAEEMVKMFPTELPLVYVDTVEDAEAYLAKELSKE